MLYKIHIKKLVTTTTEKQNILDFNVSFLVGYLLNQGDHQNLEKFLQVFSSMRYYFPEFNG